ncbi:serine protease [Mycena rebaudengoi]|nr:serine protease [Mycena rebaudengoi]
MHFSLLAALFLVVPALAAVAPLKTVTKAAEKKEGSYIVTLKDGTVRIAAFEGTTYTYDPLFNGFAANLDTDALNALRADPTVASIEEDGMVHTVAIVTQTDAPWGLQRVSQDAPLKNTSTWSLSHSYTYDDEVAGNGVDVYVVDTGVFTAHSQFEGRARWGATFGDGYADEDGNGHGTHCAGTVAGFQFGVAKKANIIAVKVLDDSGVGWNSDIIAGLSWVGTEVAASGRPSIVSMSLVGGASPAMDGAVAALTASGIHVVVAAGNDNADAADASPAREPSAISAYSFIAVVIRNDPTSTAVGASTVLDVRAPFSNFGAVVDVFAPGLGVISSFIGSTNATETMSGTSMATPHVVGVAAYFISLNRNSSPAEMSATIQGLSVKGVLTDIPTGTINDLTNIS